MCTLSKYKSKSKGFTLVELLIVVAILGILASFLVLALSGLRSKARDAQRVSELKQLSKVLDVYALNHGGYYPEISYEGLIELLQDEGYITRADFKGDFRRSFVHKALAAMESAPQDPLYPDQSYEYEAGSETDPYASPPYRDYRLRATLENYSTRYTSRSGRFIEDGGCDMTEASPYYCVGPDATGDTFYPGKPVVYLYPEQQEEVTVRTTPKEIMHSVPDYGDGWDVIADPDGTLHNIADGKEYPYLFWEGKSDEPKVDKEKGFVVVSSAIEVFLQDALQKLGLNEVERADFIEYWAPRMKDKEYVYVYFMPQDDYDRLVSIDINPKPDTLIRVYMLFASLDAPIEVEEQELSAPERQGFTAVEWGGDRSQVQLER